MNAEFQAGSEERFRTLARHAPVGIFLSDLEGNTVFVNETWCRLTGLSPEEARGTGWLNALHPEDREQVDRGWREALRTGRSSEAEFRFLRRDGTVAWMQGSASPVREADGTVSGYVGTVIDVSARKCNEEQLRQEAARAAFISQLSHRLSELSDSDAMLRLGAEETGRHLGALRCYFLEIGDPPNQLTVAFDWHRAGERSIAGRYDARDYGRPEWWERLSRGPLVFPDLAQHPGTSEFIERFAAYHARSLAAVPFSRGGQWAAVLIVSDDRPRDWTADEIRLMEAVVSRFWPAIERVRASARLQERARTLEILNAVSFALVALHDVDRIVLRVTEAAREISGAARVEHALGPGSRPSGFPGMKSQLAVPIIARSGEVLGAMFFGHPQADHFTPALEKTLAGLAAEAAIAIEAANAQRLLEQRVEERTASLREAIAQMEEFSYSVSHDLRAPLRAMNGYAQALQDDYGARLDATALGYLERIQRSSRQMEKLTYDLLAYSRIARAELPTTAIGLDKLVADVVHQYVELQPPRAEVDVAAPLGNVLGHESSLTQAAANLLTNAVKFVPAGRTPRVRVWSEPRDDRLRLWVEDNGIGIRPEHRARLFHVFERLPTGEKYEGTGIGLAIVRKAMEKMGGACGVESDVQSGSRFWLELPKAPMGQ